MAITSLYPVTFYSGNLRDHQYPSGLLLHRKELADMAASFVLGKVFQENCCAAALFHTCGRTLTTARASEWITDTNLSSSIRNKGNNDYGLVDLPRMCKARRLADSRKINQTIVNATCVPAERLVSVILSDGLAVVSAGQQVLGRAATEQLV